MKYNNISLLIVERVILSCQCGTFFHNTYGISDPIATSFIITVETVCVHM